MALAARTKRHPLSQVQRDALRQLAKGRCTTIFAFADERQPKIDGPAASALVRRGLAERDPSGSYVSITKRGRDALAIAEQPATCAACGHAKSEHMRGLYTCGAYPDPGPGPVTPSVCLCSRYRLRL